ncbi:MAG: tetratricopeptide (TPR) repeat protein [Gammaproteobacteria bacterium]|jgi:tetratricopeptide (TPR) repeat protein
MNINNYHKNSCLATILAVVSMVTPVQALELEQFIEAKEYAEVMEEATGLGISDKGVVFVTSEKQATLLKITKGEIATDKLSPEVFDDTDLGGIAIMDNGQLVIVNTGSGRIGVLLADLKPVKVFSQSGSSPGELDKPGAVSVSINNNIYVADSGNRQVSVFNDQGLFLRIIGRSGSGGDDLLKPTHIGIDAEENIYVLEGPGRFSIFDSLGTLLARFESKKLKELFGKIPEFTALAVDMNGVVYLGDNVTSQITLFDWRNQKIIQQFGALGQSRSQYRHISFLAVNNQGQLAVLDKKNKKVEVFKLEPTSYASPQQKDLLKVGGAIDVSCSFITAFKNDQTLCVRVDDSKVVVIDIDGKEQGSFVEGIKDPGAIDAGKTTVALLGKNKLHVFDHDGKEIFSVGRYGTSPGGFKDPKDVFIHEDRYYVADFGNNRVQVFAADGQFVEEITAKQDGERLFFEIGPIAVDSQQNLYIADGSGQGKIQVIDKNRKLLASIGDDGESIHKILKIHALDIDHQDRLYALAGSDYNEYFIQIYENLEPARKFGAGSENGNAVYFEEANSISILSGSKNSLYVNDPDQQKTFRFDFLEYPDAAFALKIAANRKSVDLQWSSSKSPLIERYEIQAATEQGGPFKTISTGKGLEKSLPVDSAGKYNWFQIVSVSGHGLRAAPSVARENHFQRILVLYKQQEYSAAIELADRLIKIAPDNVDMREILAMSLYLSEDYTRAIAEFKKLESVPGYVDKAILFQVKSLVNLKHYLDARAMIDQVMEKSPAQVEPYLICTQLSLDLADAIGAVTCAEDGLALHSDNVELRYLLGRAYIEAGITDDGVLAYQSIIENNPDNHAIRLKIANDLYKLEDYEQAFSEYDTLYKADAKNDQAAVGKARSLLSLDRDDEAKAIALKLSGKKETKGDGYYLLGKIAAKDGNHKEAVIRLTRAGKDRPQLIDAWLSLGQAYIAINQPDKAARALASGIKHNPEEYSLYQLAGSIELDNERYVEANAYLDTAVQLQPQAVVSRKLYARSLFSTRNYRSAEIHADAAARISPDDIDVLVLQADIANQQGKIGSAIEYLKTAISLDSSSPELQFRIGRVYQDANLFDASRSHLEKAAGIRPAWAAPHIALGNLYSKRRLFDDAVAAFEKAVELDPSESNRAVLNVAFAERKKSLEFSNNAPQLLLSDLNLETVFSAAYKKYKDTSIGMVTLKNVGATDYGNMKLSFQIKEYMDFPSSVEIDLIKGNETMRMPIKAVFNNRILEVDEDTGVQVEVKLSYLRDGQKDEITLTQPMTIYGKNAIVWGDSAMVGSFVTPKDDTLRDYVRQVVNSYRPDPGPLNENLVSAMALFSSLTASGTNYIVDPNTPFTELRDDQIDYVQFPRETLHLKSGDCDDLSVLISAGLENLGIKTAFVEIPGHLFLMFDTGVAEADSGLVSQDSSLLAFKDGNVWIPLEATMVNTNFVEAWAEGANKYQTALSADELGIIDLNQAWKEYQPVTLNKASYSIDLPDKKRTESLVAQARKELLAKSISRLVSPYQAMVVNNPKDVTARLQIAILYAKYGLYEDAELAFEALLELAPDSSAVLTNQGNLYFLRNNYTRAAETYSQAATLDDADGGIWINLSMAQYKAGQLGDARSSYTRAVTLDASLEKDYNGYAKLISQ